MFTHLFSAGSSRDYFHLSVRLLFNPNKTRICRRISLIDDMTQEVTETFVIHVSRTPNLDSRIIIVQEEGEITIIDTDRENEREHKRERKRECARERERESAREREKERERERE